MILRNDPQQRTEFVVRYRELAKWSDQVENHSTPYELFDTVDNELFPGAVLPRLVKGDTLYYAIAGSGKDWRRLSPLLKAFVGVTVTDFIGQISRMRTDDPLETWLSGFGFEAIARFGSGGIIRNQMIAEAGLLRLFECLCTSEARRRFQPRSTRQVLDDFRMALAAADPEQATAHIAFLRANLRLDALNLCFLEAQLDAAFGDWEQLQRRSFFRELCYTRRPPNVTAAMVEAVYRNTVEPVEIADGPEAALEVYRSVVHGRCGDLFKICPPSPLPPVAKMFLLAAIAGENIDQQAVDRLTAAKVTWSEDEASAFERFLAIVEVPSSITMAGVRSSWADLLHGLELAEDETETATIERAKAVLWSAIETQTLDAYRTAISYSNRLSPSEREKLFTIPGYAGIWAAISQHVVDERIPRNWCEWLELLPKMSYAQAQTFAERSATEWPIDQHLQYPEDTHELVEALGKIDLAEEGRVFTALPNLLLWVQSDENWPNSDYLSLYEQLLTIFILSDNRNPNTLQVFNNLLDGMLLLGMSEADYVQLMDELGKLIQRLGGTKYVDWLIDVGELTTLYSCPNPTSRANLLTQIIATISYLASRLSVAQLSVLKDLATILGMPDAFAELDEKVTRPPLPDLAESLRGFCIAIYTLTESVGQRVARTLTNLYPGIQVELSHDNTSSTRLVELARNADLFVICWRSAKHAATDAIRQKRPDDRTTIYASGKGSSSILAAIETHLSTMPG